MMTLSRAFILFFVFIWVSISATSHAYWKDNFPATPLETVTKKKIKDLEKQIKTLIPLVPKNWRRVLEKYGSVIAMVSQTLECPSHQ